ncbi:MAG: AraC family transcriptional regulator [Clostridia bacterium]|nr:AraC family transcriptional regulator [Clostridia bacterium]
MRVYNFDKRHGVLVQCSCCTKERPEPPHRHEFVELVYTHVGSGTHEIGGQAYPVRRGDLLFINYGETHAIRSDDTMEFYNLLVKPEFLCENLIDSGSVDDVFRLFFSDGSGLQDGTPRCVHLSGVDRAETEQLMERMYDESRGDKIGRRFVLNGYMRLVFAKLIRSLHEEKAPSRKKLSKKALASYLDANFTSPITIASMAASLHYHPAYLGRAFRALYGMGIKDYLRKRRIAYAASLLWEGDMNVSEVITVVGYTNRTQFYRDFETEYNCSPATYREKIRP